MIEFILIGSGGFSLEVAEYIRDLNAHSDGAGNTAYVTDIVSSSYARFDDVCYILGYQPKLHETPISVKNKFEKKVLICLGSPEVRHKNFLELKGLGFTFGTFVHESAWVAKSARVDEGAIICPFAFIGAIAWVGANSVINTRATVGHDVRVGVSAVLSPHCDMNGASKCGSV